MTKKKRLDLCIVAKGKIESRQKARAIIMSGNVLVNRIPVDKPGTMISESDTIEIRDTGTAYAGRGGIKLEAALQSFQIDVRDSICMDVGASTGGFTDCLLQHGAAKVYAVDVGYGQLAWNLRQDPRVTVIERTNVRYMEKKQVPEPLDLITIDVSFISLKIVVPAVLKFLKPGAHILALIKPQFEVGRNNVGKGGIVKDPVLRNEVIIDLERFFPDHGLKSIDKMASPILGAKGNREFFIFLEFAS